MLVNQDALRFESWRLKVSVTRSFLRKRNLRWIHAVDLWQHSMPSEESVTKIRTSLLLMWMKKVYSCLIRVFCSPSEMTRGNFCTRWDGERKSPTDALPDKLIKVARRKFQKLQQNFRSVSTYFFCQQWPCLCYGQTVLGDEVEYYMRMFHFPKRNHCTEWKLLCSRKDRQLLFRTTRFFSRLNWTLQKKFAKKVKDSYSRTTAGNSCDLHCWITCRENKRLAVTFWMKAYVGSEARIFLLGGGPNCNDNEAEAEHWKTKAPTSQKPSRCACRVRERQRWKRQETRCKKKMTARVEGEREERKRERDREREILAGVGVSLQ